MIEIKLFYENTFINIEINQSKYIDKTFNLIEFLWTKR